MSATEQHTRSEDSLQNSPGRTEDGDPLSVRALARGLAILSLFDVDNRKWTIAEMTARMGLLRMTVYRMVRTLEAAEYLVRDPITNQYHLGPALVSMAYVAEDQSDFVALARPFLEDLVAKTGESVTLAVEVDGTPVCVSIVNSSRPFKHQAAPGRIIGDLASVHGKVFAAFSPPEKRAELLSRPRHQHTPNTVTDPEVLAKELDEIASSDLAFDVQGLYPSTCAVGSPVRNQAGRVAAALSVVMPTGRFGPDERRLCAAAVKSTAAALSAFLGWNSGSPPPPSAD